MDGSFRWWAPDARWVVLLWGRLSGGLALVCCACPIGASATGAAGCPSSRAAVGGRARRGGEAAAPLTWDSRRRYRPGPVRSDGSVVFCAAVRYAVRRRERAPGSYRMDE